MPTRIGIDGPPLLLGSLPAGIVGPLAGLLLGVFAVNRFHSLARLPIGAAGLAVYRGHAASRAYALALGVAYAGLFVLGLIFGLGFLGGLMPLNGADHVLHILTALVASGAYLASRGQDTPNARRPPSKRPEAYPSTR
jgi:hypothetical protein